MIATPLLISGVILGVIFAVHTDREDGDPIKKYAVIGAWLCVAASVFALFYGSINEGWFR